VPSSVECPGDAETEGVAHGHRELRVSWGNGGVPRGALF